MEDHRKTLNSGETNPNSMEDHRKTLSSGDTEPDSSVSDFEFGSLTPTSPSQDPFIDNSPADHLFLNGRLQPHVFFPLDRSFSRTTSEETFRSYSTNSVTSNNSSPTSSYTPRTSIFSSIKDHHNDKTLLFNINKPANTTKNVNIPMYSKGYKKMKSIDHIVNVQIWEHITPVFRREGSCRSRGGIRVGGGRRRRKVTVAAAEKRRGSKLMKWWRRIMKAVMLACRQCHAMEPQPIVSK